jgi:hypothetical protein
VATGRFTTAGIPKRQSRVLAISMLASLEGAFVLSLAMKGTEPMEIAGAAATAAIRLALSPGGARPTKADRAKARNIKSSRQSVRNTFVCVL